jgi:hypothetical protein
MMNEIPEGFDLNDAPGDGFYSTIEQYWTISPRSEWKHDPERQWICLGGPGVDRIEFGVRKGIPGVFAYYPTEDDYVFKAALVSELIRNWCDGTISV